jgi:hypothetical protein
MPPVQSTSAFTVACLSVPLASEVLKPDPDLRLSPLSLDVLASIVSMPAHQSTLPPAAHFLAL